MIKLSIIILSFNTRNLVVSCLDSLKAQFGDEIKNQTIEILVVDNNSKDDTLAVIQSYKAQNNFTDTQVKVIQNKDNYGFTKGNNIGVSAASGEYAFLLNSDTVVQDKGIFGMVEYLEKNEKIAIMGGKLENEDGSSQASAGKFYTLMKCFFLLSGFERFGMLRSSPKKIKSVDWVSGASMLFKKSVFEKLGGFDEHIFMYLEDMELCYRAKLSGYEVYFYPNVTIRHKNHGSSNRTFAILHIFEGLLYFYKKHKPHWQYTVVRSLLHTKAVVALNIGHLLGRKYLIDTYSQALNVL